MYRTVDVRLWTDPRVKEMDPAGRLLFVYLITNPHTHMSGLYYLPRVMMSLETGIEAAELDRVCDRVSGIGLAHFDAQNELVFVVSMFRHQGRGKKNELAAKNHIQSMHKSHLVSMFLKTYPAVAALIPDRVSDTPSIPIPSLALRTGTGTEQKQIRKGGESSADADPPAPGSVPAECLFNIWNENRGSLPEATELTKERRSKSLVRIHAHRERLPQYLADFKAAVESVSKSKFCNGDNDRGWRCSFDFLIANDTNIVKIREGKYDGSRVPSNGHKAFAGEDVRGEGEFSGLFSDKKPAAEVFNADTRRSQPGEAEKVGEQ